MNNKILTEAELKELMFALEGAKSKQLTPIEISIEPKVCGTCGKAHTIAPEGSTIWNEKNGGVLFDCQCKSTIFVKWIEVKHDCLECFDADIGGCKECCAHEYDSSEGGMCLNCDKEYPV